MKKILQLLSLLLILSFSTSCEEDPTEFLSGTQWRSELFREGQPLDIYYRYIIFGKSTFDVEESVFDEDAGEYTDGRERIGGGTYICDKSSVVLMIDGVVRHEGLIANNLMLFDDGRLGVEFKRR